MPVRCRRIFARSQPRSVSALASDSERTRTNANRGQHFQRRLAVGGLFQIDEHVGAVKGNDARFAPRADERQQMHGDVPEIDMEQLCVRFFEDALQLLDFASRNLPGNVAQLAIPNASQKMRGWLRNDDDVVEREAFRFFTLLRDDDWADAFECGDLPVDVQHLRLQERRAVRRDDRWCRSICDARHIAGRHLPAKAEQNDPGDVRGIILVVGDGVVRMTEITARGARVNI